MLTYLPDFSLLTPNREFGSIRDELPLQTLVDFARENDINNGQWLNALHLPTPGHAPDDSIDSGRVLYARSTGSLSDTPGNAVTTLLQHALSWFVIGLSWVFSPGHLDASGVATECVVRNDDGGKWWGVINLLDGTREELLELCSRYDFVWKDLFLQGHKPEDGPRIVGKLGTIVEFIWLRPGDRLYVYCPL